MSPREFVYWLQGYVELCAATGETVNISPAQVKVIQDHLKLVLIKETEDRQHPLRTLSYDLRGGVGSVHCGTPGPSRLQDVSVVYYPGGQPPASC
jgi:hypothetical protein